MTEKVVKSVGRVFAILELFDRERRPMSAIDIARHLGFPHTSTLAILKSMQHLGYLNHDRQQRAFMPASSLTQVVEWVVSSVNEETAILAVMQDLHDAIDETVNLSRQTGDFVKIVHGIESTKLLGIRVSPGVVMPLLSSHTGMVALATYPDDEVERIVRDLGKRNHPDSETVSVKDALSKVHEIREQKLSPGYDVYIEGIGIICFPLCSQNGARPFVVAVAGPTERIRRNEAKILSITRKAINRHKTRLAYPV